jgi:predicted signal transduction protein with EAL and GGDEF domain
MTAPEPGRTRLRWHRRLEARVAGVLGLLVAAALGTMLTLTTDSVSSRSRERAATELEVARTAFHSHLATRTSSAISASQLITQLPVFRAHLTDARLAADHLTIDAMADDYRRELGAQFVIVTNAAGAWLASPGWPEAVVVAGAPKSLQGLIDQARVGESNGVVVARDGELFLGVSSPARFADEVLGTLTIGYQITDDLAEELARVAHTEVIALVDGKIAASSSKIRGGTELADAVAKMSAGSEGVHPGLYRIGDQQFVAGMFQLEPQAADGTGRLVLMADWKPTEEFIERLRSRFIVFGLLAFGFTLAVGLLFSRSVSRPLRDIASAATRIADGELALQLPVRGSHESITVAQAFNRMSTRLKATRDRLEHDAIHDGLTQLPNRVLLMERLERAMARLAKHPDDYRFAVLFLDLDRFKHVNDSLGHAVGDRLLIDFAGRLARAVRRTDIISRAADEHAVVKADADTLARFGGDEFVILLDDLRESVDAVRVAERVLQETALAFQVGGHEIFTTVSVGVAVSSPVHRTGGDVVRDADAAMYRAKASGGGAYVVFDDTIHEAAVERLRLETELRRAVERNEFCLFYQPIVSLTEGTIVGFEALIRWQHPERGLLPPSTFLHAAEQNGVMTAIDEWALRQACGQIRTWLLEVRHREPPTVSVNLSSKAFGSTSIVKLVKEILQSTSVPAKYLRLEVTEGVAMADPARARQTLTDLRTLGVRVSLDDFGTGYCSLSYLQQLPVDTLKIDRSFVQRMHEPGGAAIVKLIVALAHSLDLELVAEGIEDESQVAHLRDLGCAFGQGYHFGRPQAPDQVSFTPAMTIPSSDESWRRTA